MPSTQAIDKNEAQEIERILRDYFTAELGSPEKVDQSINTLAQMLQDDGVKLVHIGNVLFLTIVRAANVVEIHIIGNERQPKNLISNIIELVKYLKNIEVKTVYAYTPDNRFQRIAKLTGLPFKEFEVEVEGKLMNVYVLEL